jgi:ABC-type enterochelin transport system permease subunit
MPKETNIEATIYAVIGPLIALSFLRQQTINESLIEPLTKIIYKGLKD